MDNICEMVMKKTIHSDEVSYVFKINKKLLVRY